MIYKSSIVIERIDYLLMEQGEGESVFPQSEFMAMISEALCTPIEQIWRVSFQNGYIDVANFSMPKEKNLPMAGRLNDASQLPDWIKERIAVLQICDAGEIVDKVGQKLSDKVFYVIE